jgi:hypothetical protein
MGFREEIIAARRKVTPYLRFAKALNPHAPWAGPVERLYAAAEVGTGPLPMKGHVISFGSFSRSVASALFALEVPGLTCSLFDEDSDWRYYANEPYDTLLRRWLHVLLRVYDEHEVPFDATVALGQIQTVAYPAGRKVQLSLSITPPEMLGGRIPRRTITLDDWPSAPPESIGKAVPILYGNLTNSVKVDNDGGDGTGEIPACPCPEWTPEPYSYGVSNTARALHWSDSFSHAHGSKEQSSYDGSETDGWLVQNYHGILGMDIEVGTGRNGGNLLVPVNNGYGMVTRGIGIQLAGYPEQGPVAEAPNTKEPRYGLQAGQTGAAGFHIYPTAPFNRDKPMLLTVWGPAAGGEIEGAILGVQVWDGSYPGDRCTDLYVYTLGQVNARGGAIPAGGEAGYVTRWQTSAMQNCLTPDTWHLIELKWKMASTTFTDYLADGWVELYVNGALVCKLEDWKTGLQLPPAQRRLAPAPEARSSSGSRLIPFYDVNVTDNVSPLPVHPEWRGGYDVTVALPVGGSATLEVGFGFYGPIPEPLTAVGELVVEWGGGATPECHASGWIVATVGGARARLSLFDFVPVPESRTRARLSFYWRGLFEQVGGSAEDFFANISVEFVLTQDDPSVSPDAVSAIPVVVTAFNADMAGDGSPGGGPVYFNYWEGVAYAPLGKCACLYLTDGPLCDWAEGAGGGDVDPVCEENIGTRSEGAIPAILVGTEASSRTQIHGVTTMKPVWNNSADQDNAKAPQNAIAYGFPGFGDIPPDVVTYYRVSAVVGGKEGSFSGSLLAIHDTPHFDRIEWDPPPEGADSYIVYQMKTNDLQLFKSDGGVLRDETFWFKTVPGDQEPGGHLPADQASPARHWCEFSRQGEGTAQIATDRVTWVESTSDVEETTAMHTTTYVVAGHAIQRVADVYTTLTELDENDNEVERFVRIKDEDLVVSLVEKPSGVFTVLQILVPLRKPKTCDYPAVTMNVIGITQNADGSGDLIENGAFILRHFLLNWVFNSYERGSWFTDVADAPGLVDKASFDEVAGTDYVGAVALLEPAEARQLIMEALTSFDLMFFYRNAIEGAGSWAVHRFDTRWFDASLDESPHFHQNWDMLRDTFQTEMSVDLMANVIRYNGGPNYTGGGDNAYTVVGSMTDETSVKKAWGRIEREMSLPWTRHQDTASEVVASQLSLRSYPVIAGSFDTMGRGILMEPGGRIRLEAADAPGYGWARRVALVIGNDLNLDTGVTTLRFISTLSMTGGGGGGGEPQPPEPPVEPPVEPPIEPVTLLPLGTIMVGGFGASGTYAYLSHDGNTFAPLPAPVTGTGLSALCRLTSGHVGQVGAPSPTFPTTGAGIYTASNLTVRAEYTGTRSNGVLIAADVFERDSDEEGYWYVASNTDVLSVARLDDFAQELQTWDIPIPAEFTGGGPSPAMAVDWHDQRLYIWLRNANVWQIHIFGLAGAGSYIGAFPLNYNRGTPGLQSLLVDPGAFIVAAFNNFDDEGAGVMVSYWRTGQVNWISTLPSGAGRGQLKWQGIAHGLVYGYSSAYFLAWAYDSKAETPSGCRYVWYHYLNGKPDNTRNFLPDGDFRYDSQFVVLSKPVKRLT